MYLFILHLVESGIHKVVIVVALLLVELRLSTSGFFFKIRDASAFLICFSFNFSDIVLLKRCCHIYTCVCMSRRSS